MAFCAVGVKTEGGDSYTLLVEYRQVSDVPEYLFGVLGEELAYVYFVEVDSGISAEKEYEIKNCVFDKIDSMEKESWAQ